MIISLLFFFFDPHLSAICISFWLCSTLQTLCYMNVETLVIPATKAATKMWINKFHFSPLKRSMRKEMVHYNTLTFPDTVRLQKVLLGHVVESDVEGLFVSLSIISNMKFRPLRPINFCLSAETEVDDKVPSNNQNGKGLGNSSTMQPLISTKGKCLSTSTGFSWIFPS